MTIKQLENKIISISNLVDRFDDLFKDKQTIPTKHAKRFLNNLKLQLNEIK
jgi:hypothetical protein|tara:strand:+ start:65 stop:217 length:153 start_codon:yes stop_codon:yes gene_type:complete